MQHLSAAIALLVGLAATTTADAQEPGAAPVPPQVLALAGCWAGTGSVMGKPVKITLAARPITQGALFVVEADSHALADPADRYDAHLIFGGRTVPGGGGGGVSAFFADSFGGEFTAVGSGAVRADGFDVAYAYPDASFLNHWTVTPAGVTWTIVAKDKAGAESAFARYALARTPCAAH